jgi:uncharacterized membrane protein YhaH (DUF805 family)
VTVLRKYAQFGGRASLPEFWWFFLFVSVVNFAARAVDIWVLEIPATGFGVSSLWTIAILLPTLAVAVRRLRDGGNSWVQLLWLCVPVAGLVIVILRLCDPAREPDLDSIVAPGQNSAPPSGTTT